MTEEKTYTPRELYDFIKGEIRSKQTWLSEFGSGKKKWPDSIIDQKQKALSMLEYMARAYERKFEKEKT